MESGETQGFTVAASVGELGHGLCLSCGLEARTVQGFAAATIAADAAAADQSLCKDPGLYKTGARASYWVSVGVPLS